MSINSAMLAGASGMRANASALAAISDNIANVNTVGFKRLRNDFTALLTSQNRATTYSAGGTTSRASAIMTEQGSTVASSISTHLAVSGDGMFVVRGRSDDATARDPYYYTRAGQFTPDSRMAICRTQLATTCRAGRSIPPVVVTANPTDLNGARADPGVRHRRRRRGHCASVAVGQPAILAVSSRHAVRGATYDAADSTNNMASGAVTPDFQIPIQVYDSQGGLHTLTFSFLKAGPNQWYTEVHMPAGDVVPGGGTLVDGQLATGVLSLHPVRSAGRCELDSAAVSVTIGLSARAQARVGEHSIGLAAQTISLDMGGPGAPGGLTNYDSPSALGTSQVDGTPFGSLASVDVDDDGYVTAIFTNGLTRRIYQVPLATFGNVDGLIPEQGGVYRLGPGAGALSMRGAGVGGAGTIAARALEASTVDLAEEFSNLIMTQRAYSASSKIITTADEMLDELIRLKR
jgi:flagellar hook protein FlgE